MVFRKLMQWWRGDPSAVYVQMMSRAGCHLCDEAWAILETEQKRYGFTLEKVDIETSEALIAEHGEKIPVVLINARARFWGRINPVMLRRALKAAVKKGRSQ